MIDGGEEIAGTSGLLLPSVREAQSYRVVSRDGDGQIQRVWSRYDEARAYQLAADLRKENWTLTYTVEPVPERGQAA